MLIAQLFAMFPINGIRSSSPENLKFVYLSYKTIYTAIVVISISIILFMTLAWIFMATIEFSKIIGLLFYSFNLMGYIVFLELARNWRRIMIKWEDADKRLPALPAENNRFPLEWKIKSVTFLILILALSELM